MGEPWGVPTATGENFLGEPWNKSRHFRLVRKLPTQATMYLCTPLALSAAVSCEGSTLSKPPLMSRKREETFRSRRWRRQTSWVRVAVASKVERPRREPVWWGWRMLQDLAMRERREAVIRSTILERVSRSTMTLKEAGES